MNDEALKKELIEKIKNFQQIIYMYNQYPEYANNKYSYMQAQNELEKYTEKYCKLLK